MFAEIRPTLTHCPPQKFRFLELWPLQVAEILNNGFTRALRENRRLPMYLCESTLLHTRNKLMEPNFLKDVPHADAPFRFDGFQLGFRF